MKKCKWLAHNWEFTSGQKTDVYDYPQHCVRCGHTRLYIEGETTDSRGRLFYVVLSLMFIAAVIGLWFLFTRA